MTEKKITAKFVFGTVQVLSSLFLILIVVLLNFDAFGVQSSISNSRDTLNFYVVILLAIGLVSFIGGLFQVYDWWEST